MKRLLEESKAQEITDSSILAVQQFHAALFLKLSQYQEFIEFIDTNFKIGYGVDPEKKELYIDVFPRMKEDTEKDG